MFASRAIAASDQAVLEVSAQEMEALFGARTRERGQPKASRTLGATTQKIAQDNFQHGSSKFGNYFARSSFNSRVKSKHTVSFPIY